MGHGNNREGLIVLDSLEKGEICIRCKIRDEQVLVCSEIGCLIAVHEKCMGCDPTFDDFGKFYCPYCKHRQARAVTLEMRRRVMAAQKALLKFLEGGDKEKEKDCDDERDKRNESNTLRSGRDGIFRNNDNMRNDIERGIDDAQVGCPDQDKAVLENEVQPITFVANGGDSVGGGGEGIETGMESHQGSITKETSEEDGEDKQEEDSEPMDDGEDEGMAEGNEEREVLNTFRVVEERVVEGSKQGADTRISKENEGVKEDEKQMQPESSDGLASTEDISETESMVKPHRRFKKRAGKTIRPQNVSPSKRSSARLRKAFVRQKCTAKKNALVFHEKTTISKKSQQSSKQMYVYIYCIPKTLIFD